MRRSAAQSERLKKKFDGGIKKIKKEGRQKKRKKITMVAHSPWPHLRGSRGGVCVGVGDVLRQVRTRSASWLVPEEGRKEGFARPMQSHSSVPVNTA